MKLILRLPTDTYAYLEAEFNSIDEYKQFHVEVRNLAKFERAKSEVPFPTEPYNSDKAFERLSQVEPEYVEQYAPKKQEKVVGAPCDKCRTPYVQGQKGPYCKPCYIAWKNNK
jgi:hypothetical protein